MDVTAATSAGLEAGAGASRDLLRLPPGFNWWVPALICECAAVALARAAR